MIRFTLSSLLHSRHMSQADLARLTGIRPSTIGDICRGVCISLKISHLQKICSALHCRLSDIFQDI